MGRNLFILAATLALFALVSCAVAYTNIAQQPGSPGDASLWRTMGLVLFVISLVVALAGILPLSSNRPNAAPRKPVAPGANTKLPRKRYNQTSIAEAARRQLPSKHLQTRQSKDRRVMLK